MSYKSIWTRDVKRRQLQRQANDAFVTHAYIIEYDVSGGQYGSKISSVELGTSRITSADGFKVCTVIAAAKRHGSSIAIARWKNPEHHAFVNCPDCRMICIESIYKKVLG